MKIAAICAGPAKDLPWRGQTVRTAIFKTPVEEASIGALGLTGDEQADLTVHGGPDKAVYAYSAEHYPWWRERLPGVELPYGAFGENLTVAGFDEWSDHSDAGAREASLGMMRTACRLVILSLSACEADGDHRHEREQ